MITTIFLFIAVIHSFFVKQLRHFSKRFRKGSVSKNLFQLFGEIEIVFALWGILFIVSLALIDGHGRAIQFLNQQNFTEPVFMFVILTLCATRPILEVSEKIILIFSSLLPFQRNISLVLATLIIGPLAGSFITEPAAMILTALIILNCFFSDKLSARCKYAAMATLFVNVSVGGTLTPYAAPPVLMVAQTWNLDLGTVFMTYGIRGVLTCCITSVLFVLLFRTEILKQEILISDQSKTPFWLQLIHVFFLILIVSTHHYQVVFFGIFLVFVALVTVTKKYQEKMRLREGLLVALFLSGLVILSGQQSWWLAPLLQRLNSDQLFVGVIGLSAIADNTVITYLASFIPNLSETFQYSILAGAVCGGGLTVIANTPNPAGFNLLSPAFGDEGADPFKLLKSALVPTVIAALCFYI